MASEYISEFLRPFESLDPIVALQPEQSASLDSILDAPLLSADTLGLVPEQCRKAPDTNESGRLLD